MPVDVNRQDKNNYLAPVKDKSRVGMLDDYAKDGSEELLPRFTALFDRIPKNR